MTFSDSLGYIEIHLWIWPLNSMYLKTLQPICIYLCMWDCSIYMDMVRRRWTFAEQSDRINTGANGDITKLRTILQDSCINISFKRIIKKQFHIKLLVILHLSIIWTESNYLGSLIFHPCSFNLGIPLTLFGHCKLQGGWMPVCLWQRPREDALIFPWDFSPGTPNKLIFRSDFTSFIIFTAIYVPRVRNSLNWAVI